MAKVSSTKSLKDAFSGSGWCSDSPYPLKSGAIAQYLAPAMAII
ncbi:hypothetical protein COLO4_37006 [Corchorus olitorius]|uniref:Uncharacterized protein n=1 Tax=Corchorus olitorius TaxID=93759 RepID=A0A1R3G410_9ROSI|nr:hypothetical protein COLO4_37006 [Corchorus olitorius]